jgi:hypothetical protein
LTGTPAAPTPATADSSNAIATTAMVHAAVSAVVVNYAPLASPIFTGDPQAPTPATADNDTSIATTAFVKANLASYAPLASPAFTGNPTAPSPPASDNDTSIATTAMVQAAIALAGTGAGIPDAPSDSHTYARRNAAWLGIDTIYAPLASPALTGNPTAPTAAPGDADTSIATTAFVAAAIAAVAPTPGSRVLISTQTVASAVASVDFVSGIDSTYDEFELHIMNARPVVDASVPQLRVSTDGGATFRAGATDYVYTWNHTCSNNTSGFAGASAAGMNLGPAIGNAAVFSQFCIVRFAQPWSLTQNKYFLYDELHHATAGLFRISGSSMASGISTTAVNAIRFLYGGTNVQAGAILNLYGIKK